MQDYLAVTDVIDWQHPDILQLAEKLKTLDTYCAVAIALRSQTKAKSFFNKLLLRKIL